MFWESADGKSLILFWYMTVLIAQSCSDSLQPRELCSPPGSSVHATLQARMLEWLAMAFSRGSSQPRDRRTRVFCMAGHFLTVWAPREALWGRHSVAHSNVFDPPVHAEHAGWVTVESRKCVPSRGPGGMDGVSWLWLRLAQNLVLGGYRSSAGCPWGLERVLNTEKATAKISNPLKRHIILSSTPGSARSLSSLGRNLNLATGFCSCIITSTLPKSPATWESWFQGGQSTGKEWSADRSRNSSLVHGGHDRFIDNLSWLWFFLLLFALKRRRAWKRSGVWHCGWYRLILCTVCMESHLCPSFHAELHCSLFSLL